MRLCLFNFFLVILLISCNTAAPTTVKYADTFQDTLVVDNYHGTEISDPYRWLEDDNSDETVDWVKRQNAVTFDYLDKIPFRDAFKKRLEDLWNYERLSTPFESGGKYYQFKNDGLQNQAVMYALNTDSKELTEVLDPNKFSSDGTSSLGASSISEDGKYLAYQISEGGSDWRTVKVLDLESGQHTDDVVEWLKFSGMSWHKDGFFYGRYPEATDDEALSGANSFHKLYYHKLGTDQSKDKLIYKDDKHPNRNVYATTTSDEKYLILNKVESTSGNAFSVKDLSNPNNPIIDIIPGFDADYSFVDSEGPILYVQTNADAPNLKMVQLDMRNPRAGFKDCISEQENTLRSVEKIGDRFFASYMVDASSQVKIFSKTGEFIKNMPLPGVGSISGLNSNKAGDKIFYSFTSFTDPGTIYSLHPETLESTIYSQPEIDFPLEEYRTEQIWYTSYDGTKVPMFLTYKKGLKKDGARPTLLYGYGGFDIPILPSFNVTRLPLLENGGVYAVANIRGGGEFGSEWHKAGTKERKQNVFDDFQAAAEYLIKEKFTSSDKLAIEGRSNGGLLVGACMTQRPDLYKVAFPHVGVLDMLRYHEFTIGWAWAGDYGRSDEPDAFKYLKKYSPLHNVKELAYPATMVTTADHDDRVVPAHSFKFISELQSKHTGDDPVLIRIETAAGHGAGKPTSKRIEEAADLLSFMYHNMDEGVKYYKN